MEVLVGEINYTGLSIDLDKYYTEEQLEEEVNQRMPPSAEGMEF